MMVLVTVFMPSINSDMQHFWFHTNALYILSIFPLLSLSFVCYFFICTETKLQVPGYR